MWVQFVWGIIVILVNCVYKKASRGVKTLLLSTPLKLDGGLKVASGGQKILCKKAVTAE